MTIKYGKFEMPDQIVLEEESATDTYGKFVAEPFERGFGHTIGNSLRRMMLSSLEAPAIIGVRIEGVPHEFMPIEGVIEDMVNIVLNLKGALFRRLVTEEGQSSRESRTLTSILEITQEDLDQNGGQVKVKLGDLVQEGIYEVINPELELFTVTAPLKRQIDLRIAVGRGYVPSERHIVTDQSTDEILVDATFSPVRMVNYYVENTRVGQDTDFDRLIVEVFTDGRVTPAEALSFASQVVMMHLDIFGKMNEHELVLDADESDFDGDHDEMMDKLCLSINEMELSVRSTNCLSGANIATIAELVSIPERRMLEFRNFGKKSLNEIKAKLFEMNLNLGMDLSKYGITQDNVREKIRMYQEQRLQASPAEE